MFGCSIDDDLIRNQASLSRECSFSTKPTIKPRASTGLKIVYVWSVQWSRINRSRMIVPQTMYKVKRHSMISYGYTCTSRRLDITSVYPSSFKNLDTLYLLLFQLLVFFIDTVSSKADPTPSLPFAASPTSTQPPSHTHTSYTLRRRLALSSPIMAAMRKARSEQRAKTCMVMVDRFCERDSAQQFCDIGEPRTPARNSPK